MVVGNAAVRNRVLKRMPRPCRRVLELGATGLISLKHGWVRFRNPVRATRDVRDARLEPYSRTFGSDRGQPLDRYYISEFLRRHEADIRGRTLEIGDSCYTRKFGGDRVKRSDVLHAVEGNPRATLVGDLTTGDGVPKEAFDCVILTQTLNVIYDVRGTLSNCHDALSPGGVVLATFPGIAKVSRYDMERWGDYWRFTSLSARRAFEEHFPPENVSVETFGNLVVAISFLQGLAAEDLGREELEHRDPDYEVLIGVRAMRPERVP